MNFELTKEETLPKLVVIDVDGIMTDGTKLYIDGKPVGKQFYDRDFTAIKLMKSRGIGVVLMTGDASNAVMAKNRNIPCVLSRDATGALNKAETLTKIYEEYNIVRYYDEVWVLGDDIFDVEAFKMCTRAFAPEDASYYVRSHASVLLPESKRPWILYIVETFLPAITDDDVKKVVEIDRHEKLWGSSTR